MRLAICQTCQFAFALPATLSAATCPKPECAGVALLSDGTWPGLFQIVHQAYPGAMTREQSRELRKLLKKMMAGKVTPEQALEDTKLSPETINLLQMFAGLGLGALNFILMLFIYLQTQAHHADDQRDQAQTHEDQRQFLAVLSENLTHLHHNDEVLAERLSRAGEARLVAIEQEQGPALRSRRSETAASSKPRSQKPTAKKPKRGR